MGHACSATVLWGCSDCVAQLAETVSSCWNMRKHASLWLTWKSCTQHTCTSCVKDLQHACLAAFHCNPASAQHICASTSTQPGSAAVARRSCGRVHGCARMAGRSTRRATRAWCAHSAQMHDGCDMPCFSCPSYWHGYGPEQARSICRQCECLKLCRPSPGLLETSRSSAWWRRASLPCSEVPSDAIVACNGQHVTGTLPLVPYLHYVYAYV